MLHSIFINLAKKLVRENYLQQNEHHLQFVLVLLYGIPENIEVLQCSLWIRLFPITCCLPPKQDDNQMKITLSII